MKNPDEPAVKREAEEDWGKEVAMTTTQRQWVYVIAGIAGGFSLPL